MVNLSVDNFKECSATLTYLGYTAILNVDVEAGTICGRVINIKDVIFFSSETVQEAKEEFCKAVDSYLKFCTNISKQPDKPFSGKLPFRTTPDRHRKIYFAATKAGTSINNWMEETLNNAAENLLQQNNHMLK